MRDVIRVVVTQSFGVVVRVVKREKVRPVHDVEEDVRRREEDARDAVDEERGLVEIKLKTQKMTGVSRI